MARETKPENLYFRNDFNPETRSVRMKLLPYMKQAKGQHLTAYMKQTKLIIQKEGKTNVYTYDTEKEEIRLVRQGFEYDMSLVEQE